VRGKKKQQKKLQQEMGMTEEAKEEALHQQGA